MPPLRAPHAIFSKSSSSIIRCQRLFVACVLAASSFAVFAQATVYVPAAPPGTNSAAYAAPRDDWFVTVQGKFDRYSGKPADIVFDGDSITNRWETTGKAVWDANFVGRAADFGIEGDRTENLLWRLSKGQLTDVNPKIVVLMIGTNNVVRNTAAEISNAVEDIVTQYEGLCPTAHILLMAVFPRGTTPEDRNRVRLVRANEALSSHFANGSDPRVTFIDIGRSLMQKDGTISPEMMPDMLHPTIAGYRIWADAIQPYIDRYAPISKREADQPSAVISPNH